MNAKRSFFHLNIRWGGHILPRFNFSLSRNFMTSLLLLGLMLLIVFPTVAQDATPTMDIIVTTAPPDSVPIVINNPVDVHNAVDDVIEFLTNNLPIIFMGVTLIGLVFKVKEPQTQAEYDAEKKAIAVAREEVKKTETKFDDLMTEARYILNEIRGVSDGLPLPNPSVPPTFPPTAPVPNIPPALTTEFMDSFGVRGDNGYTWTGKGHDPAVIEIPAGYDYNVWNRNAANEEQPVKAVNTNAEYGTRLNVSFVAGKHLFTRKQAVSLAVGKHEVMLSYVADVKDSEGGQPMFNWLWTEALIDGQPVLVGTETINHRALQNGAHVATWVFDNPVPRTVTLSFEVTVHWGSAENFSVIDLRAFGLKRAQVL